MNIRNKAATAEEGRDYLVIYSGLEKPDEASIRKLLEDAGCVIDELVITSAAKIAAANLNPCDFDVVIVLLDDALVEDSDIEQIIFTAAQGDCPVIGVWSPGQSSKAIHPAVAKYGRAQVPWSAEHLADALGTHCPTPYQTPSGDHSTPHRIKHNKC